MNEQQIAEKNRIEKAISDIENTMARLPLDRAGTPNPYRKQLQTKVLDLTEQWKSLMSVDDEGKRIAIPLLVYQVQTLGVSLISSDQGKTWEVITVTDLGLGHHDTRMTVEAKDGIPQKIIEPYTEPTLHLEAKRVYTVDIVQELPKLEIPKHNPEGGTKTRLPGLTKCLVDGTSYMDNERCYVCHRSKEEQLEELNNKQKKENSVFGSLGKILHKEKT